jgi:hypothetical protein
VLAVDEGVTKFGQTDYPAILKCQAYGMAMNNLISARDANIPLTKSLQDLPNLADLGTQAYALMLKENLPHDILFTQGRALLDSVDTDENTLRAVSMGLDRAFEAEDPTNPIAVVLDGMFYTDDAWCARGSGYANTVTQVGWQLFGERLERANQILSDLYAKNPNEPSLALVMMKVVLGQQQPRD